MIPFQFSYCERAFEQIWQILERIKF